MNRELLNNILKGALYSCDTMSQNVNILLTDQELPIDVQCYQNPILDYGDISLQSIDSSERIANLINSFGSVTDIEECYRIILNGIKEEQLFKIVFAKESTNNISNNLTDNYDKTKSRQYINLSRQIQTIKIQENNK